VRRRGRPRLTEPSPEYLRRRDEIIETAVRVFHESGYEAGSLDDVATATDLRKASLYYYVDSKAQLLYLIFDRAISSALERLDELSTIEDPAQRLAAFIEHQVSMVADERSLFAVFFDSRPRLDAAYEDRIRDKERRYYGRFVDAVRAAVAAGSIPPIDPRYGAQALLGMTSWTYKWYEPGEHDITALARDYVRLVLRTDPGAPSGG
jgi:AcrR family transcriptional regulator